MPAEPIIRAAAIQIAPVLHSQSGTMEKVLAAINKAAGAGARLIVFPETLVPYYPYFSFVLPPVLMGGEHMKLYEEAVLVPGLATEAVSAAAKRLGVVVVLGVNERDHGSLYNAQLIFDADGALALKRRKITPTYHERMVWGQGDGSGLKVVENRRGTSRSARLLGALQPTGSLCVDGSARADPRQPVSRFDGRADICGSDGSDHPSSRARKRQLRSERYRVVDRRSDRPGHPRC